jgi:uncharacterized protein DUF4115
MALLVGISANATIVLLLWLLTNSDPPRQVASAPPPPAESVAIVSQAPQALDKPLPTESFRPPVVEDPAAAEPAVATLKKAQPELVLKAARGDCWLEVRAGSKSGELLFFGTLARGKSLPFQRSRLWLAFGAGSNLDVTVNGQRIENFPSGTTTATVTLKGVLARAT